MPGAVEGEGGGIEHVGVVGRGRVEPAREAQEVPTQRGLPAARRVHALDVGQQGADRPDRRGPKLVGARCAIAGGPEPRPQLHPVADGTAPGPFEAFTSRAGRPQRLQSRVGVAGPLDYQRDARLQTVERQPDDGRMARDALNDRLQVVEQEMLEPEPLVVVEVRAGQHRADVAVEVRDRAGERLELEEYGGHGLGHARRIRGSQLGR